MTEAAPEDRLKGLGDIDRLIHEPARLLILVHLYVVDSADFTFLLHRTRLTRGNLSSHLSRLEDAGYIAITKEFVDRKPHTLIRLTIEGRAAFDAYREKIEGAFSTLT